MNSFTLNLILRMFYMCKIDTRSLFSIRYVSAGLNNPINNFTEEKDSMVNFQESFIKEIKCAVQEYEDSIVQQIERIIRKLEKESMSTVEENKLINIVKSVGSLDEKIFKLVMFTSPVYNHILVEFLNENDIMKIVIYSILLGKSVTRLISVLTGKLSYYDYCNEKFCFIQSIIKFIISQVSEETNRKFKIFKNKNSQIKKFKYKDTLIISTFIKVKKVKNHNLKGYLYELRKAFYEINKLINSYDDSKIEY
ncbi:hypothetical protein A0H76_1702 [Hepatospora eriocheir]|uniref:Uncharacterized protein n=1 Tax=Hepatospora eriocheir TaxID=1081669 RepID=A0A1X0QLH6_9MICR|nr:hypothetical protein A0H76_1702 [Hepatospora eriocheir]